MSEKSRILKILVYVLPVLIWFGVIFILSSQTHQKQDLTSLIKKEISDKTIKEHFSGTTFNYGAQKISLNTSNASSFVEFFIRKFAHLLIYGLLGMLITRLLKELTRWLLGWNYLISVIICTAYAAIDEYHQSFINGRTATSIDVFLDMIGAMLGILLYLSISQLLKFINNKKLRTT